MEEDAVLDYGAAGEGLPRGEVRDPEHRGPSVGQLHVAQALPSLVIVPAARVQVHRVPVVITGDAALPHRGHVPLVHPAHGRGERATEGGPVLEVPRGPEEAGDSEEGEGIGPVQDAGGASVPLEHLQRREELGHRPTDRGEHGQARVPRLRLLHCVEVELLGHFQRIKAVITGVGTIERHRAGEEGQADGVGLVVVPASARFRFRFVSFRRSIGSTAIHVVVRAEEEKQSAVVGRIHSTATIMMDGRRKRG